MLACFAAAFRCLALSARGGLAAAAAAPLTGGASELAGWLAATLATGSDRSLRESHATVPIFIPMQCNALVCCRVSCQQLGGLSAGRTHAQGTQAQRAHMNFSSCIDVWPQEPHTTVDASRPLNRDSTIVVSASEVGSACTCDEESRNHTAVFQASPPTAHHAAHCMEKAHLSSCSTTACALALTFLAVLCRAVSFLCSRLSFTLRHEQIVVTKSRHQLLVGIIVCPSNR